MKHAWRVCVCVCVCMCVWGNSCRKSSYLWIFLQEVSILFTIAIQRIRSLDTLETTSLKVFSILLFCANCVNWFIFSTVVFYHNVEPYELCRTRSSLFYCLLFSILRLTKIASNLNRILHFKKSNWQNIFQYKKSSNVIWSCYKCMDFPLATSVIILRELRRLIHIFDYNILP